MTVPLPGSWGEALLQGKKILAAREGVELFSYKDTAPKPYYDRLAENLKLLEESGMILTPHSQMAALLTGEMPEAGLRSRRRNARQRKNRKKNLPARKKY